jgi:hypothetical protein
MFVFQQQNVGMRSLWSKPVTTAAAVASSPRLEAADQTPYTDVQMRLLEIIRGALSASLDLAAPLKWGKLGSSSDTYYAWYNGKEIEVSSGLVTVITGYDNGTPKPVHLTADTGREAAVLVSALYGAAKGWTRHVISARDFKGSSPAPREQLAVLDQMLG